MFDWLRNLMGIETESQRFDRERRERKEQIKADQREYRRERVRSIFAENYDSGLIHSILSSPASSDCSTSKSSGSCASNSCSGSSSCSTSSSSCSSSSSCGGGGGD